MKHWTAQEIINYGWSPERAVYIAEALNNPHFKARSRYTRQDIKDALGEGEDGDNCIGLYEASFFENEICPCLNDPNYNWHTIAPGQYDSFYDFYKTQDDTLIVEIQL